MPLPAEPYAELTVSPETLSSAISKEARMPAKSKAQQKAAGAALSAKRGEQKVSDLKGASRSMYKSMSEKELHDFASTSRKGKPQHVTRH